MVETPIEFETVLDVCEHNYRRIALAAVADQQQPLPINDLAKRIAEHDIDETETEIQTALHHIHLPKLEEAELIEYDSERRLAESTAQFEQGVPHLSAILGADPEVATPRTV